MTRDTLLRFGEAKGTTLMICRLFAITLSLLIGVPTWAQQKVDFAHDVLPILKARCAACHSNGTYKGGMSLDTRDDLLKSAAAVPGKSSASEMIKRITSTNPATRMPPKAAPLNTKETAILTAWIDSGLAWESGFSFKPHAYVAPLKPRRFPLPQAIGGRDHPIDRIIDNYFVARKLQPPPALDDTAFARRVYFDLIGLPPGERELAAFIAETSPGKRDALVSRLQAENRSYADHWMAFWNDLLRNEYKGTGFIDNGRTQITAWLYRSLLENKPYDQFTRELINPTPESAGFAKGIQWRGAVNASQIVELQFAQNIGQVFFGANLKCASCHDSFIDSWKLNDAYGLAAVIADKPLVIHRCDKPTGTTARARFLFPELGSIDPSAPKAKRLEQLASLVTHPDNGRFTRTIANRLWDRLMGHGIVHPVDMMGTTPWSEDLLDYLAVYLADNAYDLKKLILHIVTSRAYQSVTVARSDGDESDRYIFRGPEVKRLTAEQFMDTVWMLTGTAPAKALAPAVIPEFPATVPSERRLVRATLVHCDDLMRSLGRPNREQVVTTRPEHLTTLQALDLLNGKTINSMLASGGVRILKNNPGATPERITELLFVQALARKPHPEERATARALLGDQPTAETVTDLLGAMIMLPEFQLVR